MEKRRSLSCTQSGDIKCFTKQPCCV